MEENKYTIYRITCLENGKVYIGATSLGAEERFMTHWNDHNASSKSHRPIYQDMCSFGQDAFVVETIESGLFPEEAAIRERYWIDKLRDDGYLLYNKSAGGEHIHMTEEQEKEIVQFYENGLSMMEIGRIMKRSEITIRRVLRRNNVEMRGRITRKVLCIETGVVYPSTHEAARQLGLGQSRISACCLGKRKSTGGLHFCYPEEN